MKNIGLVGIAAMGAGCSPLKEEPIPKAIPSASLDNPASYCGVSDQEAEIARPSGTPHVIQTGQSLSWLSDYYVIPMADIIANNPHIGLAENPDIVFAGETLYIPEQSTDVTHTVKAGETLSVLALRYRTSIQQIITDNRGSMVDYNHLNEHYVREGDTLLIRSYSQ